MIHRYRTAMVLTLSLLLMVFTYTTISSHRNHKKRRSLMVSYSSVNNREKKQERELRLLTAQLQEARYNMAKLVEVEEGLYSLDEFNSFVRAFEAVRGRYRGIDKAGYELLEEEGRGIINLSYKDTYESIRGFIQEIEREFLFLDVAYIKMEREGGFIKGNLNIQVFFRRDEDEG